MAKRIIGLVLALCLVVGLLPMIALAAEPAPSTVTFKTKATADGTQVTWQTKPTEGMAPVYAKTTAEGTTTTDGASETDYNIKIEWAVGGTPTLTLNNAYLVNEIRTRTHTINISGTTDFVILLKGENKMYGSPAGGTTSASYGQGIYATHSGTLTIRSENKATDSLLIENKGAACITKFNNALNIEDANVTLKILNTASNTQTALIMNYDVTSCADKTNLTVRNSNFTIDCGKWSSNYAITLTKNSSKSADNTGDILFKDSIVNISRVASSSGWSADAVSIYYGENSTFTIDRCDASLYSNWRLVKYAPAIINCDTAKAKVYDTAEVDYGYTAGAAISEYLGKITTTHTCACAADDFDCTTANTCDVCGDILGGAAQADHTPKADDGDCTTQVMCANTGCNQVAIAAKTHESDNDDGNCMTAVLCKNAGCEHVMTPAATSHTSPAGRTCDQAGNCTVCGTLIPAGQHTGGTATCQAKANCAVCGTAYGELGGHIGGTASCTEQAKCDLCQTPYGELANHTGGTATCSEKAKCDVCQAPYGDLLPHTPEQDDGDCTTAIKCSVCQGEAVAAKTEHTYTNSQDTACDNIGCTQTRVVEPKPDFTFSFVTEGGNGPTGKGKAVLTLKAGEAAKYYTTGQYDTNNPKNWYMKETTDTTNWNIKIEYTADGVPTITLKGAKIQNRAALQFGGWDAAYKGPTKVIIAEDSLIMNTVAYDGSYPQRSAMNFNTTGDGDDVTITSVGNAKLTIATNANRENGGGISTTGNLILDNANIEIMTSEYNSVSHGIAVIGGNLTVKGGSLKITGYDDPKTLHAPGKESGYTRNAAAMFSGLYVTKDSANEAKAGNITIEGGAKVSIAVSVKAMTDNKNKTQAIYQDGIFTIKDSDVEIGLVGSCASGSKLFMVKPTLEYTNNAYTVTATKTTKPTVTVTTFTDANDSTYSVVMTPKADKIVDWATTTSIGSITYFKVVSGGNGGNGNGGTGGSGSSSPNTGDISVLLTAAVALSSAVGFAGVTVLRKKEF